MLARRGRGLAARAAGLRHLSATAGAVHIHLDLSAVAKERRPSCQRHLVKNGKLSAGLSTVFEYVSSDERGVEEAAGAGASSVCVTVSSAVGGVAAVAAARRLEMRTIAFLSAELCASPYRASAAAVLSGEGAEAIVLPVPSGTDEARLREYIIGTVQGREDVQGVLGLQFAPGPASLALARTARDDLGVRHFVACVAGKHAPRPSDLFKALGLKPPDVNISALYLAEHVPDAA